MKVKLHYLLLLLGFIAFSSCEQNEVEPTTDEATLLDFASLVTNATSNAVSEAETTNTESTCVGKKSKLTEIAVSELSSTVTTYISENYAGSTIERAGKTTQGGYVVLIQQADGTKIALVFDAAGAFVSADTHHKRGTKVAIEDLPAAITSYITTNYSGATGMKAMKDAAGNYVVVIKKADGTITGLSFTADGTFTSELTLQGDFGHKKGGKGGKGHGK